MEIPPADWQTCRGCRADIVFAQTTRVHEGKPVVMPVDVRPSETGNVALQKLGDKYHAGVVRKNQAAGMRERGVTLHAAHFATCTDANRFRKHYGREAKP